MDEFHKREADRVYYVCLLVCSILILGLIVASILIDCVRHYQRLSVQIRARAAEGGLDTAAYLIPFLVCFWMVVGWVRDVGIGIGRVCNGVKGWVRPIRPRATTAKGGRSLRVFETEDVLN